VGSALALAIGTFVIPFDLLSVSDDKKVINISSKTSFSIEATSA